jgi:hypothetical protein
VYVKVFTQTTAPLFKVCEVSGVKEKPNKRHRNKNVFVFITERF